MFKQTTKKIIKKKSKKQHRNKNTKKKMNGGFSTKLLSLKRLMKGSEKTKQIAMKRFNDLTGKKIIGAAGTAFLAYFIVQTFGLGLIPVVIGSVISLYGINKYKKAELIISVNIIKTLEKIFQQSCSNYIEEQKQIYKHELPILFKHKIDKYSDIYKILLEDEEINAINKNNNMLTEKTVAEYYSQKIDEFVRDYNKKQGKQIVKLENIDED